jgi:hypothetical protein
LTHPKHVPLNRRKENGAVSGNHSSSMWPLKKTVKYVLVRMWSCKYVSVDIECKTVLYVCAGGPSSVEFGAKNGYLLQGMHDLFV